MTRILVVGQTPPPIYGQAIMIENMLRGKYNDIQLYHVRMAFSKELKELQKLRIRKLFELIRIIYKIVIGRLVHRAPILYYPPAGPNIIPVLRDMAILIPTRWLFRKTIFHFHVGGLSDLYDCLSPIMRLLFRMAYFYPDLAIRISTDAPEDGRKLKAKKECIVHCGVGDEYKRYMRKKTFQGGFAKILFAGALRESKGVLVLVEACKILLDRGISFHVDVMGGFECIRFEDRVRALVKNSGLRERITFLGIRSGGKKSETFASADIFCFPTLYETFGIVRIEALSFGLPVVTTDWGGGSDIIEDGVCGFLVPRNDAVAVAEKLELLIKDPLLRRKMGNQARKRYLEHFTEGRYHERLKNAFEEVGASL